jgi:ABC-type dipeptide/oligopeptide/nickel transport system permease component
VSTTPHLRTGDDAALLDVRDLCVRFRPGPADPAVAGLNLGTLLGGTVIVEQIFSLPGLGQELIQAIGVRDVPVIEAVVLVFAAAVVLANLLADLLYAALDPRISYDRAAA